MRICLDWRRTLLQNWTWLCWDVGPWRQLQRDACKINKTLHPETPWDWLWQKGLPHHLPKRHQQSYFNFFHSMYSQWSSPIQIRNKKASQTWPLGCLNKVGLMWMASASLIPEYLDYIKKFMGGSARLHCPIFMCHTLQPPAWVGSQYLPWLGLACQRRACFAFRRVFCERGLKVSLLDKAVWVLVCFLFICVAHGRKCRILDEETHLMYLCVILLWVSTVN